MKATKTPDFTALKAKYPYLVIWCQMMGSYDYYLQIELSRAESQNCKRDVIYFSNGKPSFFSEVINPEVIHYFKVRGLEKL